MTTKDYNRIYHALQTHTKSIYENLDEEKGREFLNKIDRIRLGDEDVEMNNSDKKIYKKLDDLLYFTLGERIQWSPN